MSTCDQKFKYNFDTIPERMESETLKFDAREHVFGLSTVIPMWIADMDFECPLAVGQAISARAAHNVYGYDFGGERVAPSVVDWIAKRGKWNTEKSWLRFTTGVVSGLGFAIRAFTNPGDSIVIQPPVYGPFRSMTEHNDRKVIENPLLQIGDSWQIDFDDLDKKLSSARAIILCNPHNPVGRVFTIDELRHLGELCERHNVTIISDEIHSDLILSPHHHTHIAAIDNGRFAERCITFVAPSKTFNVAGLATSVAIIPSTSMRRTWDIEYNRIHVPDGTTFGHIALRAAYNHGEEWLDQLLIYLQNNVNYVRNFLANNTPMVRTFRQEGTYLMWLDFRQLNFPSQHDLMNWLIHSANLGLSNGTDFGTQGLGFARINIATNHATLSQAMSQLANAVNTLSRH
jgi:cystathionine beta-lyase